MELIFFSEYGGKQRILKRKQNTGNVNGLHSHETIRSAKCCSLVTTLLLMQHQILVVCFPLSVDVAYSVSLEWFIRGYSCGREV